MGNKIHKLILSGLTGLCFLGMTSCEDWLDVQPKSEIKSDVLFETENGFKDALIGAYLLVTDRATYGFEMTVGMVDVIAQQYELATSSNSYYQIAQFNYSEGSGSTKIASMWAKQYNAIANINNILKNIEIKKSILHPTHYAIIKGECLGLRAFLHFDMLRLFGYGDLEKTPGNLKKKAIPYVIKYGKEITPQYTVEEVINFMLKDLEEAQSLLASFDPLGTAPKDSEYELPNDDKFYTDRRKRFNYFAVRATQARVYMWAGSYDKALACAQDVITNGDKPFPWNGNFDISALAARDLTCSTEHIFGLEVLQLDENVKPYIVQSGTNTNTNLFYLTKTKCDLLYETANGLGTDYRYRWLYDQSSTTFKLLKFLQVENTTFPNNMPLIRKPEAYYIAAECLNHTGVKEDREQAIKYLNTVRQKRNITNLDLTLTQEEVAKELLKEYQKEFLSEGQMFYYYKRLGFTVIGGSKAMSDATYVLPLPDVEIEFGGRE